MKKSLLISLVLLSTALSGAGRSRGYKEPFGYDETTKTYRVNPERSVELVGFVAYNAISAAAIVTSMLTGSEPITVIINSPGGSVTAGEILMSALDMARVVGIRVDCVVIGMSYSMGFNTLGSCSKIYATSAATFLFHPVRATVGEPMRAIDAAKLALDLQKIDTKYLTIAERITHLNSDEVRVAYYEERMWGRDELPATFATPVTAVLGLAKSAMEYPNKEMFERARRGKQDKLPKIILGD